MTTSTRAQYRRLIRRLLRSFESTCDRFHSGKYDLAFIELRYNACCQMHDDIYEDLVAAYEGGRIKYSAYIDLCSQLNTVASMHM